MTTGCVVEWLERWAPDRERPKPYVCSRRGCRPDCLSLGKPKRSLFKPQDEPIGRHPDRTLPELAAELSIARECEWLEWQFSFKPVNPVIVRHGAPLPPIPPAIENPDSVLPFGRPTRFDRLRPIPDGIRGYPPKPTPREHPKPPKCHRPNSVAAVTTFKRPNWQDIVQTVADRERIAAQTQRPRREIPTVPAPKAYLTELAWREQTWLKLTGSQPLR